MRADKLEDKIYDAQERYIKREFGKEAADRANYGWFVDGDAKHIIVSTKVYRHGVLTSTGILKSGKVTHDFESF